MALHSSIANVNPGQMLHVWRNVTDGFVYVSLPGGLLPGPCRVLQRGKRHVTDSHPVSSPGPLWLKASTAALVLGWRSGKHKNQNLRPRRRAARVLSQAAVRHLLGPNRGPAAAQQQRQQRQRCSG